MSMITSCLHRVPLKKLCLNSGGLPLGFPMYIHEEICGEPPWSYICLWGASSQAHDRLVLSTLRLYGPLWASLAFLSLNQPAIPKAASQPAKRVTGSLVVIPCP